MPLLETIAIALGPSIAKAIVKSWFGQGWKTDLTSGLVDLLKGQGEKALARQDKEYRIEKIGEQIAARMRTLFEHEGATLGEQKRAVIAQEVALTLAKSRITSGLLVGYNLDPQKLARYLLDLRPDAMKTFSAAESALYERTLTEAARSITEIATELSGFDRVLAATQLQTDDQILEGIAKLLALPNEQAERFEQKYCEAVKKQLDRMEIFGVPSVDPLVRRQSLSVAYITLDVDQGSSKAEQEPDSIDERQPSRFDMLPPRIIGGMQSRSGPVDQVLTLSRRLVIRGQAGSGKSTLLQWIAVRSANHDLPPHLASWNNTVPLFVRLRSCVNTGFPTTEEFPRQIAPMIAGEMPRGWVHAQLECGRAVILIDGVDELPRDQRSAMLECLKQLVASYPLARYIVTSRPAALKVEDWPEWREWINQEGFVELNLQSMTTDQIDSFIDHWHAALAQALTDDQERQELAQHPANLKRLLRQRPPLRRLATSPLLCGMICALHRERRQSLPAERLQLYQQCVEMLLSGREEVRKLDFGQDYPPMSYAHKLALIQHFAYWLMRNSYSDVEANEADNFFNDKLAFMNLPNVTGHGVRCLFVDRTSLLREPVAGRIDFTHRTFQEFLAAQTAVKENDIGLLIQKGLDDQWREMIMLAAGEARPRESEKLLKGLITKADKLKRERNRHQLYLLAVACLETCVELAPSIRELVLQRATALIPPKDKDEVKLIAVAGDPIVPLLASRPDYSNEQAAQCIEALAMIGTDQAMKSIVTYASDTRYSVSLVLGQAWDSFDRRQYAQQVLIHIREMILFRVSSWEGFEYLGHLTGLDVFNIPTVDLRPLAFLTNLQTLMLQNEEINDLSPLAHLSNLQELQFHGTRVSDLSPLKELTKLRLLGGSGTLVRDLSPLAHLTDLQMLYLGHTPISDLSPLAHLTSLQELYVGYTQVDDLSPLAHLPNLKALRIQGIQLSDLNSLASFTRLQELRIGEMSISNLSPLAQLTNLEELEISKMQVNDLRPLASLNALKRLDFQGTQMNDITALADLNALEYLNISETQISDLSPLANLTNLKILNVSKTQVSDISLLASLNALESLDICSTQVDDISPLANLSSLKRLYISKGSKIDLSPLHGKSGLKIIKQ